MNTPQARSGAGVRPRLRDPFRLRPSADMRTYEIVGPQGATSLNRSAGEILALCDGTRELDDIVAELERRFDTRGLAADVHRFIDEARRRGWLD
jgi:pyrroloquinoline quinone biosynthesis protein D